MGYDKRIYVFVYLSMRLYPRRLLDRARCVDRVGKERSLGFHYEADETKSFTKSRLINGDLVKNGFDYNHLFVFKIHAFNNAFYGREKYSFSCFFYGVNVGREIFNIDNVA